MTKINLRNVIQEALEAGVPLPTLLAVYRPFWVLCPLRLAAD